MKQPTLRAQVQGLTSALELAEGRLKKEAEQFVSEIQKKGIEQQNLINKNEELQHSIDQLKSDIEYQTSIIVRLRETCTSRLHLLMPEPQPSKSSCSLHCDDIAYADSLGRSDDEEIKMLKYILNILNQTPGRITCKSGFDDLMDAMRYVHKR